MSSASLLLFRPLLLSGDCREQMGGRNRARTEQRMLEREEDPGME